MIHQRYRLIVFFFAKLILNFIIWDLLFPRVGLSKLAKDSRKNRYRNSARAYRTLAVNMGGVLIKVGQFFSARVDVLPPEITDELANLQDEVPAVNYEDIRTVAENDLGESLDNVFINFEQTPIASASLGQVHRAKIPNTEIVHESGKLDSEVIDVVVKIQRPGIEKIIATDLRAINTVGKWLRNYPPIKRRADVMALLAEFEKVLYEEIDYIAEGRNAEIFSENFQNYQGVKVPKVYWSFSNRKTLTLENVWAIKITDYQAISEAGLDRREVASRLLNTYLKQIFEDGFFHADPHPGNLFVYPANSIQVKNLLERDWQLTFVDFGMVGHVLPEAKKGLRELLIGIGTRNTSRVIKSYQILGILLPHADLEMLEKAEEKIFERFWGLSMSELQNISFKELQEFTLEFRDLIFRLPFQIPQDFIYLARAVGILAGMCTGLDPEFNVWEHLVPYAEKLISEEVFQDRYFWIDEVKLLFGSIFALPTKINAVLTKIDKGEITYESPQILLHMND